MLLSECTGRDLWPVQLCREKGVPEDWIEELADCYESGFKTDRETIYYNQRPVNQFHGIHDLQLARKLGQFLGIDIQRVTAFAFSRVAEVRAIQEAVDEI